MKKIIVFGPSSELEKVFFEDLFLKLRLVGIDTYFVTTEYYAPGDRMYDFGFDFQWRLDVDYMLITKTELFGRTKKTDEYLTVAAQWLSIAKSNPWFSCHKHAHKQICKVINEIKPEFCLVWGDHRPFSLLAIDILHNLKINFSRIDRGFLPNSYRLYETSMNTSIKIPSIDVCDDDVEFGLREIHKNGGFTYQSSAQNGFIANKYVLFVGASDVDVGIYVEGRYKESILPFYKTSYDAYLDVKNYIESTYGIACFFKAHPFSPENNLTNIH
ncbi:MAG: hypothetical protein Q8J97_09695 [Flavobacteriaceae bacterium]|nr:hypothetical protein [Flavobacteriaceae bacterium]